MIKKAVRWTLRLLALLIIVAAFSLLVPYFIQEAYSQKLLSCVWTASDLLGYYGAILGGGATLLAVVLTIRYEAKRARREDAAKMYRDKLMFVRNYLFGALQTLDSCQLLVHSVDVKDPTPTIDRINKYCIEVARIQAGVVLFDQDQKGIIGDAHDKLSGYAQKYQALLNGLNNAYSGIRDVHIFDTASEIISLSRSEEEKEKRYQQIRSLKYTDFQSVVAAIGEEKEKIVELYNNDYGSMLAAVIQSVDSLAKHYDEQVARTR